MAAIRGAVVVGNYQRRLLLLLIQLDGVYNSRARIATTTAREDDRITNHTSNSDLRLAIGLHVRAIIAVLGIKRVIPKAIPRAVLSLQENRPFPRTLSSQNDSISYKRKGLAE